MTDYEEVVRLREQLQARGAEIATLRQQLSDLREEMSRSVHDENAELRHLSALVDMLRDTFDPGGTAEEWAAEHERAIDALAALVQGREA